MPGAISGFPWRGGGYRRVLLASSVYMPRMVLNVLQCTPEQPGTKNDLVQNGKSATVKKP